MLIELNNQKLLAQVFVAQEWGNVNKKGLFPARVPHPRECMCAVRACVCTSCARVHFPKQASTVAVSGGEVEAMSSTTGSQMSRVNARTAQLDAYIQQHLEKCLEFALQGEVVALEGREQCIDLGFWM